MIRLICFVLPFFYVFTAVSQSPEIPTNEQSITRGQKLFGDQCSKCHLFGSQKIGPSLASVTDKRSVDWLISFISTSQQVIASGDPYAQHLVRSYHNMVMPDFAELGADQIMDILAYIQDKSLDRDHSYVEDSVNYYDAKVINKAQTRYENAQPGEKDYYKDQPTVSIPADIQAIQLGASLFSDQCARCHRLDKRTTGPALASVTDRLPLNWLLDFIDNPKTIIETGNDYANFLLSNYPLVMPGFNFLSQKDKLAILAYIRNESGVNANSGD